MTSQKFIPKRIIDLRNSWMLPRPVGSSRWRRSPWTCCGRCPGWGPRWRSTPRGSGSCSSCTSWSRPWCSGVLYSSFNLELAAVYGISVLRFVVVRFSFQNIAQAATHKSKLQDFLLLYSEGIVSLQRKYYFWNNVLVLKTPRTIHPATSDTMEI